MFTGIISELGRVRASLDQGDAVRLEIEAPATLTDVAAGDSIAVDGCCLTVAERTETTWTADVMAQTLATTSLGSRHPGDAVNLERAVRVADRLGGHIVQGHVDGVGTVRRRVPSEHWTVLEIGLPDGDRALGRYLVDKGSVAVDGVSLTIAELGENSFTVSLIPETLRRTTLGERQPGDRVNLEVDVLAKHVERLLSARLQEIGSGS